MAGRGRGKGTLKGLSFDQTIGQGEAPLETQPSELFPVRQLSYVSHIVRQYKLPESILRSILIHLQKHPNLKKPRQLTDKEQRIVRNYKAVQDAIHAGPLYTNPTKRGDAMKTTYSQEQFNDQYGENSKADFDPFNGVETYSKMKAPPKKTLPKLEDIKFDKSMFPRELWPALEGEEGEETKEYLRGIRAKAKAKMDSLQSAEKSSKGKTRSELILEKIDKAVKDGGFEDEDAVRDAVTDDEVEEDESYEDDEDGGDYNAEGYFDDGAEDSGDGEGGDDGF